MPNKKTDGKKEKVGKTRRPHQGKKGGQAMQQQGGINPIVGATVGAAVGGVVGAAAAVALSDKETREKLKTSVKTAAGNLRDQAASKMEEMKGEAQDVAEVTKKEAQKKLVGEDKKKAV